MPSLKLSNNDLEIIRTNASALWRASQNTAVESHLWPTACFIKSFTDFLANKGLQVEIEVPVRQHYESVDE